MVTIKPASSWPGYLNYLQAASVGKQARPWRYPSDPPPLDSKAWKWKKGWRFLVLHDDDSWVLVPPGGRAGG